MSTASSTRPPLGALGMASLVLGVISLLLAPLPVLGIPISSIALLLGILSLFLSRSAGGARLRWALMGVGAAVVALGVNIAMAYAPWGYSSQNREPAAPWRPPQDRPDIPPPER